MKVDRGGRVIDAIGDFTHRDILIALFDEQIARRIHNLLAESIFVALAFLEGVHS